jgi:hypothetical protein
MQYYVKAFLLSLSSCQARELVRLQFTNCGALFVTNFYLTYGQTLKIFSQECEGSNIIFDDEFSYFLNYFHL